jgi:alpha-ketoglutarate-dependent taurine dioxygenase
MMTPPLPHPPLADDSVVATPLGPDPDGPVMIAAARPSAPPGQIDRATADMLHERLARHKALLLRGFGIDAVDRFQLFLAAMGADLLEYSERSTPRSRIDDRVYTSTEYPKTHEIPMHNESSYSAHWPRRVFFCCLQPAQSGGATPIADSRAVFAAIDPAIRDRFIAKQVMYVRNYGQGVDLPWQEAFQTEDRLQVEAYCRASGLAYEWFDDGHGLHTHHVRPAAVIHVPTAERVWFNQAHLFHVSSLEPSLRRSLTSLFPPDRLPRHACYGDGTAIEDDALDHIRQVFARVRLFPEWRAGDVLLLDNLFYAHGRQPFTGDRRVIVAMDGRGGPEVAPL